MKWNYSEVVRKFTYSVKLLPFNNCVRACILIRFVILHPAVTFQRTFAHDKRQKNVSKICILIKIRSNNFTKEHNCLWHLCVFKFISLRLFMPIGSNKIRVHFVWLNEWSRLLNRFCKHISRPTCHKKVYQSKYKSI